MERCIIFFGLCVLFLDVRAFLDDSQMHPSPTKRLRSRLYAEDKEYTANYWQQNAQSLIKQKLRARPNTRDGMSIPTLAATRVYIGGEEEQLSFEKFPHTALSKTYCVDAQTADSACSATAYLGGVKGNIATIGVTAAVELDDCEEMIKEKNHVTSIAKWSQDAGKRTGLVTTSMVTDASPAGTYAHTANRLWQDDTTIINAGRNVTKCRDIAYQLIKEDIGKKFNVILGGGSRVFFPNGAVDDLGSEGTRSDGVDLIDEWLNDKEAEGKNAQYIWNRTELLNIDSNTDYVLGLFSEGYMPYNLDRDTSLTPSLEEMTEAAIKIALRGNGATDGYFLFIEGGRIDHGHHETLAKKSLEETSEFSKAIQKALDLTNEKDTLIVVTSDHAHTMTVSGYPDRNNNIFAAAGEDENGNLRLTLNYANGPGYKEPGHVFANDDTNDKEYQFPSIYNLTSETHGGDDVGVFAMGPWAHLYSGVIEENVIPHILAFASCVGNGMTACRNKPA